MAEVDKSFLAFEVERKQPGGGDIWTSRNMRVHHKDTQGVEIKFREGVVQTFNDIGKMVAIVQHYEEGMLEKLKVDAVIEVDAPNLVLDEPFIFEQTTNNTMGMTLTGIPNLDEGKMDPGRSMESVMLVSGGEFTGPLQAGFTPREVVHSPIGKTLVKDQPIRLKVYDLRPKIAAEVPQVEPVSKL